MDFINRAVNLSIYDDLVVVATKSILKKCTHYFQAGLLDKLNQSSLDKIKIGLATSSWVGDADSYLFIQDSLMFRYNHFPDDFSEVVNQYKNKLFNILKSKSSKKSFIQMIEDNLICDGDVYEELEDEVMDRMKDHLKSQSWEQMCDGGNAFINVLKYLREEENIESELYFDDLRQLDDEGAIDWRRRVSHMFKATSTAREGQQQMEQYLDDFHHKHGQGGPAADGAVPGRLLPQARPGRASSGWSSTWTTFTTSTARAGQQRTEQDKGDS